MAGHGLRGRGGGGGGTGGRVGGGRQPVRFFTCLTFHTQKSRFSSRRATLKQRPCIY